jgi:hypothetical protein
MNPIKFPEQNGTLAKNQPEYRPLPICIKPTETEDAFQYTCKYELTELELAQINQSKTFYFSQFGSCFHPILPQIENPFAACNVTFESLGNSYYNFWIPMQNGTDLKLFNIHITTAIAELMLYSKLKSENLFFIEKPNMAISENGLIDI